MFEPRPKLAELKIGDKVTVISSHTWQIRTVATINKSFIVDDKGGKWALKSGYEWGNGDSWSSCHIQAWIVEDDKSIEQQNGAIRLRQLKNRISEQRISNITEEQALAILSILKADVTDIMGK